MSGYETHWLIERPAGKDGFDRAHWLTEAGEWTDDAWKAMWFPSKRAANRHARQTIFVGSWVATSHGFQVPDDPRPHFGGGTVTFLRPSDSSRSET